jgi:transcriptional regulator with XRE-family HTH domain
MSSRRADPRGRHTGTRTAHFRNRSEAASSALSGLLKPSYSVRGPLPRSIFHRDYPHHPTSLGQLLRRIRIDLALQIKDVAAEVGIAAQTISNWELSQKPPTPRLFARLCQFYIAQGHPEANQLRRGWLRSGRLAGTRVVAQLRSPSSLHVQAWMGPFGGQPLWAPLNTRPDAVYAARVISRRAREEGQVLLTHLRQVMTSMGRSYDTRIHREGGEDVREKPNHTRYGRR